MYEAGQWMVICSGQWLAVWSVKMCFRSIRSCLTFWGLI